MVELVIKDAATESWLAHLDSDVIPRVGEKIRLSGFDNNRPVMDVQYVYGHGEDSKGLSYVNILVGPQERK